MFSCLYNIKTDCKTGISPGETDGVYLLGTAEVLEANKAVFFVVFYELLASLKGWGGCVEADHLMTLSHFAFDVEFE